MQRNVAWEKHKFSERLDLQYKVHTQAQTQPWVKYKYHIPRQTAQQIMAWSEKYEMFRL